MVLIPAKCPVLQPLRVGRARPLLPPHGDAETTPTKKIDGCQLPTPLPVRIACAYTPAPSSCFMHCLEQLLKDTKVLAVFSSVSCSQQLGGRFSATFEESPANKRAALTDDRRNQGDQRPPPGGSQLGGRSLNKNPNGTGCRATMNIT